MAAIQANTCANRSTVTSPVTFWSKEELAKAKKLLEEAVPRGLAPIQVFSHSPSGRVPIPIPARVLEQPMINFLRLMDTGNELFQRAWGIQSLPVPPWLLVIEYRHKSNWTCHFERRECGPWDLNRGFDTNLLTETIKHRLIFHPERDSKITGSLLAKILMDALQTLEFWFQPGGFCIHCQAALPVRMWKPTTCSATCTDQVERYGFGNGFGNAITPFLADISVLDFLFCCIYSAAPVEANAIEHQKRSRSSLLPGCPIDRRLIRGVVDSFPRLMPGMDQSELLGEVDDLWDDRHALIEWLCRIFQAHHLVTARGSQVLVGLSKRAHQFILMNSTLTQETIANSALDRGFDTHLVYHGTDHALLFQILSAGLATDDPRGIFVAQSLSDYAHEAAGTLRTWSMSCFKELGENYRVVLQCELMKPSKEQAVTEYVVPSSQVSIQARRVIVLANEDYNRVVNGGMAKLQSYWESTVRRTTTMLRSGSFQTE